MDYKYTDKFISKDDIILPNSNSIQPVLIENHKAEIIKALEFISSEDKFLYVHGFLGTGKRQFVNYVSDFLSNDVIKLEYYCKEATVCDDILLNFTETIENLAISSAIKFNAKISTLSVKFQQQISSIKKPFIIILHSFDDILPENITLVQETFARILKENNIKLIVVTRAMLPSVMGEAEENEKIFLKALKKDIFKNFLTSNQINISDKTAEDFYNYTRGYYYYVALTIKIIKAMGIDLNEFLQKFNQSNMSFDAFLGMTYINLIPNTIRNFFWFLRTLRHGLTLNALALLELYDEFSIEYLKANLMVFETNETIYVHDYFLQKIDISIPAKTEIKLHKYIIGIYENLLRVAVKERAILISRQALRSEIEYHSNCIKALENNNQKETIAETPEVPVQTNEEQANIEVKKSDQELIKRALSLAADKKYTEAIEELIKITQLEDIDLPSLVEVRLNLANLYKTIDNKKLASHYYELVETYYKQHKEYINLNYLYYEMTDLYFKMYKQDRAIDTIKKVIYSVDTPQSLMVSACTLLGNIYSDMNNPKEAYIYYQKALESLDENVNDEVLADLYFKLALANDDNGEIELAFDFYNKCISIQNKNQYKALAYSNMGSCYLDSNSYDDAEHCFIKAYEIEKCNNNYEGIYYTASKLAQIYIFKNSDKALDFLVEAKKSAEFINEDLYILDSTLALGDFYYNNPKTYKEALTEYLKAQNIIKFIKTNVEVSKIEHRIKDMRLRMKPEDFNEIESRYARKN